MKKLNNKLNKFLLSVAITASSIISFASNGSALVLNNNFQAGDLFQTTVNTTANKINVRSTPCGPTVIGNSKRGVTAYYLGESKVVEGTCKGFKDATWYKVGLSSKIPDGGTEYVEGWVIGNYLDHISMIKLAETKPYTVRVNVSKTGTLNLRVDSLTGEVLTKLKRNDVVDVLEVKESITINGAKQTPVYVRVYKNGKWIKGYVTGNYLAAFEAID